MARLAAPFGVVGIAFVLLVGLAQAGTAADGELRAIGTFSLPVYVTAPPGDGERLFVVEQAGRIRVVHAGTVLSTPFLDITGPVLDGGERGLLSIAFAPDYAVSGLFYAYYTVAPSGDLRIAEFRRSSDPNVADAGSERPVLTVPHPTYANHNGGQLQFGADGYLYIATGDGGGGGDPFRAAQRLE
jgi:glucose/arabinose dehydrogenase